MTVAQRVLVACALAVVLAGAGAAVILRDARGPSLEGSSEGPSSGGGAKRRAAADAGVPAGPLGARVLRRTQLRTRPGGRVVGVIGPRTHYASVRMLAVVRRRGDWLGVLSEHVPGSHAAWIPAASAELVHMPYSLDVDLSARRVLVRHEGRVVRRVGVAIGRPSTATPTGRFAVTDALRIVGSGRRAYGCCALALTGRQRNLPQGWGGGDRLAIHGTTATQTIGSAASGGCLRATEADMRWLMRRIRGGALVRIRA